MELRVIGCHGGETPQHRTSAFLIDDVIALDAGSLTSGLSIPDQASLKACIVSHAHLDHIRDLATISDTRCQLECPPLIVAATRATLRALRKHFFNNVLWPDFTQIPSPKQPTIEYLELKEGSPTLVENHLVLPIPVHHSVDSAGFIIESSDGAIAYSGDTGPTDLLWKALGAQRNLKALVVEVSFPNREQKLASSSGHHTPRTLGTDLKKYAGYRDLPTMLYHMKPVFQGELEKECAKMKGHSFHVLQIGDHFVL